MLTTIRNTFAFLLPFFVTTACDYVPPSDADPSTNPDDYAPGHSVQCGPFACGPSQVCCVDPQDFSQSKCATESDCPLIPIACDGSEDCALSAICCGDGEKDSPLSSVTCATECTEPDVRMCRMENSSSTCLSGSTCVQMPSLPPGFGSCRPTSE